MVVSIGAISSATMIRSLVGMLSGPEALCGFRCQCLSGCWLECACGCRCLKGLWIARTCNIGQIRNPMHPSLSRDVRKPGFPTRSDKNRHKPGCTATEDALRLEISDSG